MPDRRKLDWKKKGDVGANARRVLSEMARAYFAAGREAAAARTAPAELHEFRLHTKQFRYTLALFESLYGPSMRDRLALLKPLQDCLGQVNDCVATSAAFEGDAAFREYLDRRASGKAKAFQKVWKRSFDAAGQEEDWVRYLSNLGETEPAIHREGLAGDEIRGA